jgi:hypothetical protein
MCKYKTTFWKDLIWAIDVKWLLFDQMSLPESWEEDETWVKSWVAPWVDEISLNLKDLRGYVNNNWKK